MLHRRVRADINVPQQPREKLAAKIPPPAPFQTDRDLGVASKLAKQQGRNLDSGAVAGPIEVFALREQNQDKKDRELSNKRLADAGAVKSADKPAGSAGMMAAAAPAPAPSAKPAQAAPVAEPRNDTVNAPLGTVTETVTVEGESTSVLETVQTPERKAKDEAAQNEVRKEAQAEVAAGAATVGGRNMDSLSTTVEPSASPNSAKRSRAAYRVPRWTLSADGVLQRSFDSGKTWQTIPVASDVVFRALATNDSDIWVGGAAGALYHSSDAGQHWVRVYPAADGQALTADIVTVEFSDAQHGKLTTGDHETWTTSNAGNTWQKH